MRTTIRLDDQLLAEAKELAARSGVAANASRARMEADSRMAGRVCAGKCGGGKRTRFSRGRRRCKRAVEWLNRSDYSGEDMFVVSKSPASARGSAKLQPASVGMGKQNRTRAEASRYLRAGCAHCAPFFPTAVSEKSRATLTLKSGPQLPVDRPHSPTIFTRARFRRRPSNSP